MNEEKIRRLHRRLLGQSIYSRKNISFKKDSGPFPLSFTQHQMWTLYKIDPLGAAYNVIRAFFISGPLDEPAFATALESILQRHAVFQLCFFEKNGVPFQKPGEQCENYYQYIELFEGNGQERRSKALDILQQESRQPFDLSAGNNLRVVLIKISESEFYLLFVLPHIISDGWSMGVLMRDLVNFYVKGPQIDKTDLPIRFIDYAIWQNEHFGPDIMQPHLDYYTDALKGIPFTLNLPTDRPRRPGRTANGRKRYFSLGGNFTQKLKDYCRQEGVTLYMTLVAALSVLLYRYTGHTEMTIGSPVASRNVRHARHLIGCFMNTIVLPIRLNPEWTIKKLLRSVCETILETFEHQELPFVRLFEVLHSNRKSGVEPLYNVLFTLQNTPGYKHEFAGIKMIPVEIDNGTSKFDLNIIINEAEGGLAGTVEYNVDIFDPYRIKNLISHYERILKEMVGNSAQTVAQIPLLSERERHHMVHDWNAETADFPCDVGLHHLIERHAENIPSHPAVVCEGQMLTYKQLNDKAFVFARVLLQNGLNKNDPVGIYMGRSADTVVAILGILKAGCKYVPLDSHNPQDRLEYMIRDAGITTIVCQDIKDDFIMSQNLNLITLEECVKPSSMPIPEDLFNNNDPAYIIYTSGSTGRPKGVVISHKNVLAMLYGCEKVINTREYTTTTIAAFSFDSSVWEMFSTLCFGGTLHVITNELLLDTPRFARYLIDNHITRFYIYPYLISGLLKEWNNLNAVPPLKFFLTGLEPKTEGLLQKVRDMFPDIQIANMYGPTETTVMGTYFNFIKAQDKNRSVPIGRPIPNYRTYIVDKYNQLVPVGIPGELLIGGDVVSRGYHNRPELQNKFPPDPFLGGEKKVYCSGDVAYYLPDGNIDFIGRSDDQVKIRGFRVEPGETEAVLAQHPDVDRAAVVVKDEHTSTSEPDRPGTKKLVGYVACRKKLDGKEIRDFLSNKLPDYMIPSAIVVLDSLPLLPSGKVDRKSLPEPDISLSDHQDYIAPQTPLEKIFTKVWQNLLGIPQISVHDNFFDLGVHSLLIMQFVAGVHNECGLELGMGDVFEYPTVSELAAAALDRYSEAEPEK
ncbi:amino acid adenylation domain-containing protein [candidate division KSB1 bacterium]|nr:amino acid adenylation domain-containing protein [candidate division KSB1 bacterium]